MTAKDRILNSAIRLSKDYGWLNLTRENIAREAACSEALVSAHYGLMDDLRARVMEIAVERRILSVVQEGMAVKHPAVRDIDHDLRAEVLLGLS